MKLIIRDGHAEVNGDQTTFEMPSGSLVVLSEDGRALFDVALEGCELRISCHSRIRHSKTVYTESLCVKPKVSNVVNVCRVPEP